MATSDFDSPKTAPVVQNILIDFGDNGISEGPISDSDPRATPGIVPEGPAGHPSSKEETTEPDINSEAKLKEEPGKTQRMLKSKAKIQKIFQRFSNIRALVICLWVIQNSVVSSFSVHPQSSRLSGLQPLTTKFSSSLVAIGRLLLVPCLYFIAGFETKFYPLLAFPSKSFFLLRRVGETYFMIKTLELATWMSKHIHNTALTTSKHHTAPSFGYYGFLQPGQDALLNGPMFFALSINLLELIFYICLYTKYLITGLKKQPSLTNRQYVCVHALMLGILFVYVQSNALSAILDRLQGSAKEWIYTVNGASAHFPILYLFAYYAGTRIHRYLGALTAMHLARRRASLSVILCFAFLGLTALNDYFPRIIGPSLDLRHKPILKVQLYGTRNILMTRTVAQYLFGMWMIIVVSSASETILITALSSKVLGRSWGSFTRYAYIQVHTQMLLGFAPNPYVQKITDNVLLRGVIHGILSIIVGYMAGIVISVVARIFAKLRSMYKERRIQKADVTLDGV